MTFTTHRDVFKEARLVKPPSLESSSILLERNRMLRVVGPVRIEIVKGCIRVLGADVCSPQSIYVNRYRSYTVKAVVDSMLSFFIGDEGAVEQSSEGEEVIDLWEQTAASIARDGGRVVVLGVVDSGKTSFSTLLSNIALDHNLRPAIVDADVGQCDLAPPGFIALKLMNSKTVWLRELRGDVVRFIGYTTPSTPTAMGRIISAVMELISIAESKGSNPVIINTDGWFGDLASIEYKYTLIKCVKPKSVVALGSEACSIISNTFRGSLVNVYCLPKPKFVRCRNREDRRELRKLNYSMYFKDARRVCLDIDSITLLGSCLYSGAPLSNEFVQNLSKDLGVEVIAASKYDDVIIVMVPDTVDIAQMRQREGIDIVKPSGAKGLISAVINEMFEEQDIAVVDEFNPISRKICVLTPYKGVVRGIIIGRVRVDESWSDKGRVSRCPV